MHAAEKWAGRELRVKVKCVRETERERTKDAVQCLHEVWRCEIS